MTVKYNQIDTIYTTVSDGRTHIAADNKYIGSVDSYNNCFTQLFAWVFRQSMTVHFDGKTRSVNKESYKTLLQNLAITNLKISDVSHHRFFRSVAEEGRLPEWNVKMRDVIKNSDAVALFHKLAYAISSGNTSKALLMIGKGALLDVSYYDRGHLGPSFYADNVGLSRERAYQFTVFKAAPILQASIKSNDMVVRRLQEAGANTKISGEQYTFERKILGVERDLHLVMQPTVHIRPNRDRYGHRMQRGYQPRLQESTSVITQDFRSHARIYTLQDGDNHK